MHVRGRSIYLVRFMSRFGRGHDDLVSMTVPDTTTCNPRLLLGFLERLFNFKNRTLIYMGKADVRFSGSSMV